MNRSLRSEIFNRLRAANPEPKTELNLPAPPLAAVLPAAEVVV